MDKQLERALGALRDAADTVRGGGELVDLGAYVEALGDLCKGLLSDDDISFAIAIVFDEDTGVFSIVESLLPLRDNSVARGREKCWHFLRGFVEQIGPRALPYAPLIKEKSLLYFRRDDAKSVQTAALTPLIALLECNTTNLKPATIGVNQELSDMLVRELRKSNRNNTCKGNILQLLGNLVENFKEVFEEENVLTILNYCLNILNDQLHNDRPTLALMAGAIKSLDSLLTWFDESLPAGGSVENSRRIFTYIEQVLLPREELNRYDPLKACLRLLSRHAGLFGLRLIEDGIRYMHWLQEHCTHINAKIRDAALPAYDQFITQVSSSLVSDNRIQNGQTLYKVFIKDALDVLDTQNADPKKVSLAIRAVGKFAAAIVKFSGKESLKEAFHRLEPFGASIRAGEGREGSLGYAVTLVGAFADIVIHLEDVEDFMVTFIAQVTGNIFYQFPQLFAKQKQAVYTTLRSLLKALYSKGTIYSLFLNNIVWSSLQRAMEPVDEAPEEGSTQLWSHYVELWSHLLEFPSDRGSQLTSEADEAEGFGELVASDVGNVGISETALRESVFDAIMHCVIKAMTELNLKYKAKPHATTAVNTEDVDSGPLEPGAEMDAIEPLDMIHMRKYLNLVEFVQALLSGPCAPLLQKWTYSFGRCVIELSSAYPLISGFYKLLAVNITTADREGFFLDPREGSPNADDVLSGDRQLCIELFSKYLQEVLVASRRYKLELLAACLRLCLSAPPVLVGIASIVPPLKNALKIGIRYLPLAAVALDALERWQTAFPDQLQLWLPQIVPCLNDYLVDVEKVDVSEAETPLATEGASTSAPTANVSRTQLAQIKRARAKDAQPSPLEIIQVRVQKFLGRIGGFAHLLVSEVDLIQVAGTGGLAWDPEERVKFNLPFRQDKPDIWLDSLLPRIVEIALSSSDRRMKVTACELLQAVCLLMLGNAAKGPMRRRGEESQSAHFDKIYRRIFPAILRLATDVELVTRQLFMEFAKQLIHWFTSNQQKENPDTMALLDAILDGLVDPENGSLREFCADCFSEFMRWSVRHAPPEADNFVNVTSMLRRVYNRMDHPNPYHRLGAAMAAYRMYPVLRENAGLVDRFIFEILFFCIKSVRLGELDDEQTGAIKQMNKTVDQLQKLISRNIMLLRKNRKDRQLFVTLEDFLSWAFEQTGLLQEKSRTKSMMLLSSICQTNLDCSFTDWFHAKLGSGGKVVEVLNRFDVNMDYPSYPSLQQVQLWLSKFVRSIHWFEWALKEKLLCIEELLNFEKNSAVHLASSISAFRQCLLESSDSIHRFLNLTPGEQMRLQNLRYEGLTRLLNLLNQVLNSQTGETVDAALRTFFMADRSFQELLSLVLLKPRRLGFVLFEPQRAQDLAKLATKVIKRLTDLSSMLKSEMIDSLRAVMSEDLDIDLNNLSFTLNNSGKSQTLISEDTMSLVKGCQQLSQVGILQVVLGKVQAENFGDKLLLFVFQMKECPPSLKPNAEEMIGLAMALGVKISRLVELVLNEEPVANSTNRKLTAGEVFYMNFRNPIVRQVKFYYKDCLGHLLEAAVEKQAARMLLVALLEDYLKPSGIGSITKGSFLREFLQHVAVLAPFCKAGSSLPVRQFVLEIIHKLLKLDTGKDVVLTGSNPSFNFIIESFSSFLSCFPEESTNSSFGSSASFTLKCESMSLLPFFYSANVPSEVKTDLTRILSGIVTEHLLVRESDIPRGSTQHSNYSLLLSQLLGAFSVSHSLELLEVVFPLLQTPNMRSLKAISEAVEVFAETLGEKREAAFNLCLTVITDSRKSSKLRRAIVDVVFGAFVNYAPAEFVTLWYSERINDFYNVLKQTPSVVNAEREFEDLSNIICHYGLVELLYSKSDSNLIMEIINPVVPSSGILRQASRTAHATDESAYKMFPENLSTWRELHAAAYNCLAAIYLCTNGSNENIFSGVLFCELKGHPLWRHLVDLSKVYDDMPVETSQSSMVSQTIKGMRADRKARRTKAKGTVSQMTATISSQYMISASLSQEPAVIKTFLGGPRKEAGASESPGAGLLLDEESSSTKADVEGTQQGPVEEVVETAALDQDDFDQHECMGVVLRLIEYGHANFGARSRSGEMPGWMKGLHAIFENAATHINVRLFLVKVITKACKVFAPYAAAWFRPYVQTILNDPSKSGGLKFHYMLRDICITVLQWNMSSAPDGELATRFVQHLINVAAHGSNQVLHANIDIIRLFLENWKESINLKRRPLVDYLIAGGRRPNMNDKNIKMQRSVGLQLLGAVIASGFPIYDPMSDSSTSEAEMCEALLNNLSVQTKEVYEAAAELLGIAMKYRREMNSGIEGELLEKNMHKTMKQLYRDAEYEKFFNILNKVTIRDPTFLEGYATMVVDQLPRLFGAYKVNAIDTLLRHPKADSNLLNQILRSLPKLLAHKDEIAQLKILQLLSVLLKDATEDQISEKVLPVLCDTFNRHESVDCRREFYEILMYLFKSKGMDKGPLVVQSLVMGLCDSSDIVRGNLQNFWHLQLSQDVLQRFSDLVNQIYDRRLEENWAQISNVLMLKLCEDSVDYNRPIFSAPLSECVFHDYTINTSWIGASLPMTPLFSSTQMTMDTQGTEGGDGDREFGATQHRPRMIRATMAPSLSQTITQTQGSSLSSTQGVSGSALFALSQRPGGVGYTQHAGPEGASLKDPSMNLRRRILNPRVAHSQVLSGVLRANRRREARSALQSLERANKVHMMRQYRTGELPDIEIKHADIIRPLAALAERDATFARLLLKVLFGAVYSLPSKGPEIKAEVRQGLEAALVQTNNGISFVSCVETLCLEDPEIWIPPKLVGSASRKSTNYHSGILLLEKEILNETFPDPEPNVSSKRHKGRGGQANRDLRPLEDAWVELAVLYKALGEDDIVLGLFKTHIAKREKTHKALEYQLGGNIFQALTLYDEAVKEYEAGSLAGDITNSEIDIWYSQRLACLADLSEWELVMNDIVYEITDNDGDEPDFQRLWEPTKREKHLGYFIRGALREPAYHTSLNEFVQASSDVLLDEFSTHLATLAAINNEWDRTKFRLGQCYRVFRRHWTALHPLALRARHLRVRQLQKAIELEEFITFITKADEKELPRLLGGWHKRWPSPEFDDVEAWDDVAQNRLIFFNHIQEHFSQQLVRIRTDEGGGNSVISQLNLARANLYIEAANGLTACGAFHVSKSYINKYMGSKFDLPEKYRLDFRNFEAMVRLLYLQAERAQSAGDRLKLLNQLLNFVHRENITSKHPDLLPEFQMTQADVYAQVARAILSTLPREGAISQEVIKCFSLLGSAYKAYSSVLPHDDPLSRKTATGSLSSHERAKVFLKFGLFCDELYKLPQHFNGRSEMTQHYSSAELPKASELPQLIVQHMLKALALDSTLQAQHAVARLLSLVGLTSATASEFERLVENVSSWVFVPWIPQILANIEEVSGNVLVKVLESIAKLYPQSLYFSFRVSEAEFGATGRQRTQHLKSLLSNPLLEGLVRALEDLTYPEQRLKDGLLQIAELLHTGDSERAQLIFSEIFRDCLDTQALTDPVRQTGEWNVKFAREWAPIIVKVLGENGSKLRSMDTKQSLSAIDGIVSKLGKSDISAEKLSLGTLSKWLADFDRTKGIEKVGRDLEFNDMQIEIPGQYNSLGAPHMSAHVQLVGFDQVLVCMRSKQRPKILTMRGSDEKEYKFVVKGGEDLRLDQRIEQLFEVMNNVLNRDASCSQRKLAVRTYSVIPVSKKCGLLQFVENTSVLQDIIIDGLSKELSSRGLGGYRPRTSAEEKMNGVRNQCMSWVEEKGGSKKYPEAYCEMYRKVGFEEVSQKLSALEAELPRDALQRGFSRLVTSAESYLALRSHFARSLSVVSICGYIAGVGDRHLSNTLVDLRSGALVPIDFGYSFGTNVLILPVPELVPFRLTSQLRNFLLPLDAVSLLRNDMVRIMSALHGSRDLIAAVMEVFVKEPLVDWKREAVRLERIRARDGAKSTSLEDAGGSNLGAVSSQEEHVHLKVETAQCKLNLWNPAEITISEIRSSMHANKPYTAALEGIVRGDRSRNPRARAGTVCQTVQEQVDCLLDQATDPNLLGRIYFGWQPWV
ncbi:hypothetical protein M758_7G027900 [Ceratodon purpureus]|nr:hypothetical protein M758_7G027900 [Ceratodon purpureus]